MATNYVSIVKYQYYLLVTNTSFLPSKLIFSIHFFILLFAGGNGSIETK